MNNKNIINYDFEIKENSVKLLKAELESVNDDLNSIEEKLKESQYTLSVLTPNCDKVDYILAASVGCLCGIVDVFLVGKPGESVIGDITDKWFENRTKDFAKLCGWKENSDSSLASAIRHLEKLFKVPYDQTGAGDAAREVFSLNPKNHHFKSLGHNPTLLGLFYSIVDQFCNESHFVTDGDMIILEDADGKFELKGKSVLSKIFCGFVNWIGHLISDVSGSSSSKGRGQGIPSPFWSWANDIIVVRRKLGIPKSEFDRNICDIAVKIYEEGFDTRFQVAQMVPVFICGITTRFVYSIRRVVQYFISTHKDERSLSKVWKTCKPFSNASIERMITVAHSTFCLVDISDAVIRGVSQGNVVEFFLRLNIAGVGRLKISLYGEIKRKYKSNKVEDDIFFLQRRKTIIEYYKNGLHEIAEIYDDKEMTKYLYDLDRCSADKDGFLKSIEYAENMKAKNVLKNKSDIDEYFNPGR